MKVYVVLCDCGLNGAWVESVHEFKDTAEQIADQVNRAGRSLVEREVGEGSYTGFSHAEVVEVEVEI